MVDLDLRMLDAFHDTVEAEDDRAFGANVAVTRLRASVPRRSALRATRRRGRGAQRLGRRAAGRPALDAEDRDRGGRSGSSRRSSVAERAHRAWSSIDEDVAVRAGELREPVAIDAIQPRHVHDAEARRPRSASSSDAVSASCSITGPYAKSDARRRPRRSTAPRPGASRSRRAARSAAARARWRAGSRRSPPRSLDRPAQERPGLLGVPRLDDRHVRAARASSETSRTLWCDLPGPAGISPA